MAKTLTIKEIKKGNNGTMLIYLKQRSSKPYVLSRKTAEQFHVGDTVILRNNKLCKC